MNTQERERWTALAEMELRDAVNVMENTDIIEDLDPDVRESGFRIVEARMESAKAFLEKARGN
jgi:hypothetical protein